MNVNLGWFNEPTTLSTIGDYIKDQFGEAAVDPVKWVGTGVFALATAAFFIWTLVTFVQSMLATELDKQKTKRRLAIRLLIISIVLSIVSGVAISIFLGLDLGDLGLNQNAVYDTIPKQLLTSQFILS